MIDELIRRLCDRTAKSLFAAAQYFFVLSAPERFPHRCGYCGARTKDESWRGASGHAYPPCCYREACIDTQAQEVVKNNEVTAA